MADENTKKQTFGEGLRRLRMAGGVTQAELAAHIGVSASLIALFESGKRRPGLARCIAMAEALGMSRTQRNALLARAGLDPLEIDSSSGAQLESEYRKIQKFLFSELERAITALSDDTPLRPAERRILRSISQKVQQLKRVHQAHSRRP